MLNFDINVNNKPAFFHKISAFVWKSCNNVYENHHLHKLSKTLDRIKNPNILLTKYLFNKHSVIRQHCLKIRSRTYRHRTTPVATLPNLKHARDALQSPSLSLSLSLPSSFGRCSNSARISQPLSYTNVERPVRFSRDTCKSEKTRYERSLFSENRDLTHAGASVISEQWNSIWREICLTRARLV